jgi:hypothetical protein
MTHLVTRTAGQDYGTKRSDTWDGTSLRMLGGLQSSGSEICDSLHLETSETSGYSCLRAASWPIRVLFRLRDGKNVVRFEVFTAVTMKNVVFWDVTACGSCKNNVSEEFSASFIRVTRIGELGTTLALICNRRKLCRLLVTANVVPSSPILVTLTNEALSSSET